MDKTGQMQQKSKDVVAASYKIALLVAKQKQPHTIAESLILPGTKILVKRVFGEQAIAKLNAVSLSDNTIKRQIEEMSDDIADQILAEIKESKFRFAIQLDESTDITNYCQLLVYVRYAQTNIMKTELLLNHEVSTTTKGKDIFDILDSFFKKNGLDWKNLVGCTTDGAPSMLGCRSGFQLYVKAVSPNVTSVHCFIHRFALRTKVRHRDCPAINFWLDFAASYPTLASRAVSRLSTFPSTWECELGFSTFLNIKSKKRNRLVAPQHDFRCAVSESIKPRIDRLVDNKQSQKSH